MPSESSILAQYDFPKIDAHVHLNSPGLTLADIADETGLRLITINTDVYFFPSLSDQKSIARNASGHNYICSFSAEHFGETGWQDSAIRQIEKGMNDGALGLKIWKNIGMELKDSSGDYMMANHPQFDPVYEYLSKNGIPLLTHLGEPKNCWLPLEEMTVTSDRDYFSRHPEYHMYLNKDVPSYQEQLHARNQILEKHSNLKLVGAHLASIEWSVDELAKWLNRFPETGVDLAERVCHLQHQAADNQPKIKQFIETFQDRIIYGSDQIDDGSISKEELEATIHQKWISEFRFFAEETVQTAPNVTKPFRGLGLDKKILKKIFYDNAFTFYPRLTE